MSPSLRWPKGSLFRWDSTSPSSRKQHAMPKFFSNNHQSKWAKVALPGVCIIIFYIRLGIFCASTLPMAWFSALLCELLRPQHQDFSGFSCVFFDWVMILWKFQRSCHELNNYWYIYISLFLVCVCVSDFFFISTFSWYCSWGHMWQSGHSKASEVQLFRRAKSLTNKYLLLSASESTASPPWGAPMAAMVNLKKSHDWC